MFFEGGKDGFKEEATRFEFVGFHFHSDRPGEVMVLISEFLLFRR